MTTDPSPKPDRLALIKKLAKKKKRRRADNAYPNRIVKEVSFYSEIKPTKTTL